VCALWSASFLQSLRFIFAKPASAADSYSRHYIQRAVLDEQLTGNEFAAVNRSYKQKGNIYHMMAV
jgi:hypothetical protein